MAFARSGSSSSSSSSRKKGDTCAPSMRCRRRGVRSSAASVIMVGGTSMGADGIIFSMGLWADGMMRRGNAVMSDTHCRYMYSINTKAN